MAKLWRLYRKLFVNSTFSNIMNILAAKDFENLLRLCFVNPRLR